jgi:hypothetical protein
MADPAIVTEILYGTKAMRIVELFVVAALDR